MDIDKNGDGVNDLNGLLIAARVIGNRIVDPVVDVVIPGTTVKMEKTGHILSVPRPDLGETFIPYVQRVTDQAHGNQVTVGALMIGSGRLFARFGGFKEDGSNWAQAADCFYNLRSYMTDEERKAADRAKESWNRVYETMRNQRRDKDPKPQTPADPPKLPDGEVPL